MGKKYEFKRKDSLRGKLQEKIEKIRELELPQPKQKWQLLSSLVVAVLILGLASLLLPKVSSAKLLLPVSINQFSETIGSQVAGCDTTAFTNSANPFWQKYPHACFAQAAGNGLFYDPARNLVLGQGLHGLFLKFANRPVKLQLITGTGNCGPPQVTEVYLFDFAARKLVKALEATTDGCGPKNFVVNLPISAVKDNGIGVVLACGSGPACFWRNVLVYS